VAARDDALVVCDGEWDISRAQELARLGATALARGRPALILDFSSATFVDASTIGAICMFSREAARQGVQVAVASGEGFVRRVFELAHLGDALPVATTAEAAARAASGCS
jgi:anti-anti-sigma factor